MNAPVAAAPLVGLVNIGSVGAVVSRIIDLIIVMLSVPVQKAIYTVFVPSPGVSAREYVVLGLTTPVYGGSIAQVIFHVKIKFAGLFTHRISGNVVLVYQSVFVVVAVPESRAVIVKGMVVLTQVVPARSVATTYQT